MLQKKERICEYVKKHLIRLAAFLLLTLCVIGAAGAEETEEEYIGWKITESSVMTEEARAVFDAAVQEVTDAVYEPVALLGEKQGVYCILCRTETVYDEGDPYYGYTLLYAGENGVQNAWDLWIDSHDTPEADEAEEETPVNIGMLVNDLASVREAGDRVTEDMEALKDNDLAVFIADRWQKIYMNPDYRLPLNGRDDPAGLPVSGKHAFVILGFELENGEMKDELKARCDAAAAAAAAFPESILVCSGGAPGENNPDGHTEAGLMKDYLVRTCGVAPERILIDENATTTLENAVNTFTILKDQGIETITIVTSSYHQQRAGILYETLAEIFREKEGISIRVAGNYSCEFQAPAELAGYDARIAAAQLAELVSAMENSSDPVR